MIPGTKIPRALIAVAEGVDDLQTVTLIDVLRRAQIEVVVASIEGRRMLTCARGTRLTACLLYTSPSPRDS